MLFFIGVSSVKPLNWFILQNARPGLVGFQFWKMEVNNNAAKVSKVCSIPLCSGKKRNYTCGFSQFSERRTFTWGMCNAYLTHRKKQINWCFAALFLCKCSVSCSWSSCYFCCFKSIASSSLSLLQSNRGPFHATCWLMLFLFRVNAHYYCRIVNIPPSAIAA